MGCSQTQRLLEMFITIVKVQVFRTGCVVCSYVVVLTWIFGQNKLVKFTLPLPWNDLNPGQDRGLLVCGRDLASRSSNVN